MEDSKAFVEFWEKFLKEFNEERIEQMKSQIEKLEKELNKNGS